MDNLDRRPREAARRARLAYLTVSALADLTPEVVVLPDTETSELDLGAGFIPADLVVQHLDLRLRLILLIDAEEADKLVNQEALRAAELILKHWPETAAVGLVSNDSYLSCLLLEPYDVEPSIGTPSGQVLPPTARREPRPIADAIRTYLQVVAPDWDQVPTSSELESAGYEQLAPPIARQIQSELVERRANIPEKREALDSIDDADARWAAGLTVTAGSKGVAPKELADEVGRRAGKQR